MTDAAGGVTEYAYDAGGIRTEVWDPLHTRASGAADTRYTYDALNRVTAVQDPLGNTTSLTSLLADSFFSLNLAHSSIFKVQQTPT